MEKIVRIPHQIDLRAREKIYEEFDFGEDEMEMENDEVGVGSSEVVACSSVIDPAIVLDEERERTRMKEEAESKAKRWLARRQTQVNRLRFMEEFVRYWPQYGVLLEYEVELSLKEKICDDPCVSEVVSNSDDELDVDAIRSSPAITRWFLKQASQYWPGLDGTDEDESFCL